ncbi:MAG TPA: hypothetical protein VFW28_04055, partial [Micropepsaceae bacterium]|nr:hypothetical protein [Micropepsaceae bacterium]
MTSTTGIADARSSSGVQTDAGGVTFDVGVNGTLPFGPLIALGFQNIFGMIGMFVFPGIVGQALHLPMQQTAY